MVHCHEAYVGLQTKWIIRDFVAQGFSFEILLWEMVPRDNQACRAGVVCGDDVSHAYLNLLVFYA